MALAPKRQRFVREYLIDLNGTQAAIRAGYSAKTAGSIADFLLKNVDVRAAMAKAMEKRADRTEITQDRVLLEIGRLAFLDAKRFYNRDGSLRSIHELDDDTAAAVIGIEMEEDITEVDGKTTVTGRTKKLKITDKVAALTLAARHLGMLTDKVKIDGEIGIRQLAAQMRERAMKRRAGGK